MIENNLRTALLLIGLFMIWQPISGQNLWEPDISIVDDPFIGPHLAGPGGYTLYVNANDTPDNSTCYGSCASNFQPFYDENISIDRGLSLDDFDSFNRTDGTRQSTYMGRPLYRLFGEPHPGTVAGEGAGGIWFAARPRGLMNATLNMTA